MDTCKRCSTPVEYLNMMHLRGGATVHVTCPDRTGKSAIVHQFAAERGIPVIDLPIADVDPSEIIGADATRPITLPAWMTMQHTDAEQELMAGTYRWQSRYYSGTSDSNGTPCCSNCGRRDTAHPASNRCPVETD